MSSGTTDAEYPEPRQPLYEASTQFQNWRSSQEGLTQIREKLNETAVAAIRNTFEVDEVKEKKLCFVESFPSLSFVFPVYDDCAH